MRLSDEHLRGRTVIASDGLAIGEIAMVQSVGDAVVLSVAVDKLRQVLPDASDVADVSAR